MKAMVLTAICTTFLLTVSCSVPAPVDREKPVDQGKTSYDFLSRVFHLAEIASKSWKLPDGTTVGYLSKQTFHVQDRHDILIAFYGPAEARTCIDIFFLLGADECVLIGHEVSDDTYIQEANVREDGGRVFVNLVRINRERHKRIAYSYEFTRDNALMRTMSTIVMDEH